MKQLSIEEKARRYDEAIETAKRAHNSAKSDKENGVTDKITGYTIQLIETIFPELKDSEEQVAQKLHELLCAEVTCEQFEKHGLTVDSALYWLEKQQKASKVEEAMRDVEQKAKAFTEANKGETSEEMLVDMRGVW